MNSNKETLNDVNGFDRIYFVVILCERQKGERETYDNTTEKTPPHVPDQQAVHFYARTIKQVPVR